MALLYLSDPARGVVWAEQFARHAPDIPFHLGEANCDPAMVRYLVTWAMPAALGNRFPNLEVLFSVGAGIDQFDLTTLPPQLAIVRMIDPGITRGMVEYATMAVLAVHRNLPLYIDQQRESLWHPEAMLRPAEQRPVGVLGLGVLGQAVLAALAPFGFPLAGWSRSPCSLPGVDTYAGGDGLPAFLARTEILVCLLPLTDETLRPARSAAVRSAAQGRRADQCRAWRTPGRGRPPRRARQRPDTLGRAGRVRARAAAGRPRVLAAPQDHSHPAHCQHDPARHGGGDGLGQYPTPPRRRADDRRDRPHARLLSGAPRGVVPVECRPNVSNNQLDRIEPIAVVCHGLLTQDH